MKLVNKLDLILEEFIININLSEYDSQDQKLKRDALKDIMQAIESKKIKRLRNENIRSY